MISDAKAAFIIDTTCGVCNGQGGTQETGGEFRHLECNVCAGTMVAPVPYTELIK